MAVDRGSAKPETERGRKNGLFEDAFGRRLSFALGTGLLLSILAVAGGSAANSLPACTITGAGMIEGTSADDVVCGGDGADVIDGHEGNDVIIAAGGNDDLIGGTGADTLVGGEGDDRFFGGGGSDEAQPQFGPAGAADIADYSGSSAAVQVDLGAGLASGEGDDTLAGIESVRGSEGDDDLQGNVNSNFLFGEDGNDVLEASLGEDWHEGGPGADHFLADGRSPNSFYGDDGDDTVDYADAVGDAFIALGGGASVQLEDGGFQDVWAGMENAVGSQHDDRVFGTIGPNVVDGQGGHDEIHGQPAPAWALRDVLFESDADGDADVYLTNEFGWARKLTKNEAVDRDPVWHPAGGGVYFSSDRSGNFELYLAGKGGYLARLSDTPSDELDPSASPEGARIAFVSNRSGRAQLYTMSASGKGVTRGTRSGVTESDPAWSPDGKRIAFVRKQGGDADIELLTLATGRVRTLTGSPAADLHPTWISPQRLAFASDRDGDFEIYSVARDRSGLRRLTENRRPDLRPAWSPFDARIYFSRRVGSQRAIYSVESDGGNATRLGFTEGLDPLSGEVEPQDTSEGECPDCPLDVGDELTGGGGEDNIYGGAGGDTILGGPGADVLVGAEGDDDVRGGSGLDRLLGGPGLGFDQLFGNDLSDVLYVFDEQGGDEADGGPGEDICAADPEDAVLACP
jgi:Ca2+-binding RTX toxin-like protein